jgi:replication factor A1
MTFHYALVDDLLTREEFDRRVEEVMEKSGDLLDEPTAAMIVVRDLGRAHVKMQDLGAGSTLACFFGKVISASSPREFQRSDGTTGWLADLLLGDETGQVRAVLWDEKAGAAGEVEVGEVLEVIAKPSPRKGEVTAMAFRKAACEISCGMAPDRRFLPPEPVAELEVVVLEAGKVRTFARRDGSEGRMVELIVGNPAGISRLVCWEPDLLAGVEAGSAVRIRGATRSSKGDGEEYSLDGKGEVVLLEQEIEVPVTPVGQVPEAGFTSVKGVIRSARPRKVFTTRQGHPSAVRNLTVSDGTGEIALVLWGEKADLDIAPGDEVTLYRVEVRAGRDGGRELHAGRGSAVLLPSGEAGPVELEGMVIPAASGTCLEVAGECHPVQGEVPVGRAVLLRGSRVRRTIHAAGLEVRQPDPAPVRERLARFRAALRP